MLCGTGAGLINYSGQSGAAALGNNDAVGTGTLGGADNRTQIVHVADLVADDHKRRLVPLCGDIQNILHGTVFPHSGQSDHALMGVSPAHGIQLAAVGFYYNNALFAGSGSNMAQCFVHIALGNINFIDAAAGTERFRYRVAAFDHIFSIVCKHSTSAHFKAAFSALIMLVCSQGRSMSVRPK